MRKNLPDVPVQITIGRIPSGLADEIVDAGEGLSLKGRAVLLRSAVGLEQLLASLDVNPAAAELIVRATRLLEASNPQPHTPQTLKSSEITLSRVAIESAVRDLDLDPQAAADVIRTITRAQQAVIARRRPASEPGDAANVSEGVL